MPIVIEAQYQKRLGLPGYSSHSFGITVRMEVPDLTHVERESPQLYSLLQSSVDREIQQEAYVPELPSKAVEQLKTSTRPPFGIRMRVCCHTSSTRSGFSPELLLNRRGNPATVLNCVQ